MKTILQLSIAFFLFLAGGKAQAQTDGTLDTSFNTGTGIFGSGLSIISQPDGKIIIGGGFTEYNGQPQNYITRLNTNGTLDTSFNIGTGFSSVVWTTALQTDGKILTGGNFTSYNGQTQKKIGRLNTDGTLDTSFNTIVAGFTGDVFVITLQLDGKILAGGGFTENSGPKNHIVRLNTDGSVDDSFEIEEGFNNVVFAIDLQPDGKILVGGAFTEYNGQSQNHIARLNADGSLDTTFNIDTGFAGTTDSNHTGVYSIALQPDGKILVGGTFTEYNGQSQNHLVRLNVDGSIDTSFNNETGFVGTSIHTKIVEKIILQPDGKILVGGWFTSYNGQNQKNIIRLNTDGSIDTSFSIGTGFNASVRTIALQSDGKILAAGDFWEYNGQSAPRIARLHNTVTASIGDFEQSNVSIYPNPVSNEFMISVPSSNIEIFDIMGKKVFEQKNVNSSVDVSHLSKGLYILKGQTERGVFTAKIVKQ